MLFCGGFDGFRADIGDVAAEEALDFVGDDELLHDDGAAEVTKGGGFARDGVVEGEVIEVDVFGARRAFEGAAEVVGGGVVGLVGFFAIGELTDEALSDKKANGTRENRVRADEVDHAREGSGGGVRVEGREDEVTGNRGLDSSAGGVGVANLTDHDDVRVETEDGAEAVGERTAVVRINRNLGDASDTVFDRVFEGDNLAVGRVQGVQN